MTGKQDSIPRQFLLNAALMTKQPASTEDGLFANTNQSNIKRN